MYFYNFKDVKLASLKDILTNFYILLTARFDGYMMKAKSIKSIGRYYYDIPPENQNEGDMLGINLQNHFKRCQISLLKQINIVVNDWRQGATEFQKGMVDFGNGVNMDDVMQGDVPPALANILRDCRNELSELVRKLCWRYLVMPPEGGMEHRNGANSAHNNPGVQKGIAQFCRKVRAMTINDYMLAHQSNKSTPVFECNVSYIGKVLHSKYLVKSLQKKIRHLLDSFVLKLKFFGQ